MMGLMYYFVQGERCVEQQGGWPRGEDVAFVMEVSLEAY